jgi:hypothetical protein
MRGATGVVADLVEVEHQATRERRSHELMGDSLITKAPRGVCEGARRVDCDEAGG